MNLLNWIINGVRMGSIYALIALGYNMVYGMISLINFAHGDIIMVGAYMVWLLLTSLGLSLWVALLGAMVACALLGILIEQLAYKPLLKAPRISMLITALGVSIFLQNLFMLIFGSERQSVPLKTNVPPVRLGEVQIDFSIILTVAVSVVTMVLLLLLVKRSKMGKAMRAVSEDTDAARLMGININSTIVFTFSIGSALAGLGSFFLTMSSPQIQPFMGSMPGLKAFVAAVLGGIGSIPGAMLGGFVLGMIESIAKGVASQWTDAVVFAVLIVVLLVKPAGLLGKHVGEKV